MLRVVGLALLLTVGIAGPAAAAERQGGAAGAGAIRGAKPFVPQLAAPVQLTAPSLAAQASFGVASAGLRRELVTATGELAAVAPGSPEIGGSVALPWLTRGTSGLRLRVSEQLSFGLGYRRLQGEDLWRRYAEAGSVDYDSHDFLLRAHWRF